MSRDLKLVCSRCGTLYMRGCTLSSICPACELTCNACENGERLTCPLCLNAYVHECLDCGRTKGMKDPLADDASMECFMKLHPLTEQEEREVRRAVHRLTWKLRLYKGNG